MAGPRRLLVWLLLLVFGATAPWTLAWLASPWLDSIRWRVEQHKIEPFREFMRHGTTTLEQITPEYAIRQSEAYYAATMYQEEWAYALLLMTERDLGFESQFPLPRRLALIGLTSTCIALALAGGASLAAAAGWRPRMSLRALLLERPVRAALLAAIPTAVLVGGLVACIGALVRAVVVHAMGIFGVRAGWGMESRSIGSLQQLVWLMAPWFVASALVAFWLARRSIRAALAAEPGRCGNCGYRAGYGSAAKCPECGLSLDPRSPSKAPRRFVVVCMVCLALIAVLAVVDTMHSPESVLSKGAAGRVSAFVPEIYVPAGTTLRMGFREGDLLLRIAAWTEADRQAWNQYGTCDAVNHLSYAAEFTPSGATGDSAKVRAAGDEVNMLESITIGPITITPRSVAGGDWSNPAMMAITVTPARLTSFERVGP